MNNKLNLILFIIIGLFLAGIISRNGSITALIIPFMAYLWMGLLTAPGEAQLHVSRELSSPRCQENEPVRMLISIENKGAAIPRLRLEEPHPSPMTILDGEIERYFALQCPGKYESSYTFQFPRGSYRWETVKLITSDAFGLFEKPLAYPTETQLLVWPDVETIRRFPYHPHPTLQTAGPYLSRLPGSGIDFWGVREYQPGDPLRNIHWRLAARHPQSFFSKIQEREEMADIGILLDARTAVYQFQGSDLLFETAVQAAASLSQYFLYKGNRVSMLVMNDSLVRVFPGYGRRQLTNLLDQLAGCTLGNKITFDSLKYLPARLFPSRSVILLVSPVIPDDLPVIARLQAEGYQLLVVIPNPVARSAGKSTGNPYLSYAIRISRLERQVTVRQLQKKGVQIIDWDVSTPLSDTLAAARFSRRSRRR